MFRHGNPSQGGGTYELPPGFSWSDWPPATILPLPENGRHHERDLFDFPHALRLMNRGISVQRANQREVYRVIEGRIYARRGDSSELEHLHSLQTSHIMARDWHIS